MMAMTIDESNPVFDMLCVWLCVCAFLLLGDDLRVDLDLDFKSACFGVEEKVSR